MAFSYIVVRCAVFYLCIADVVRGKLTVAPESSVALIGGEVRLNCRNDDPSIPVNWMRTTNEAKATDVFLVNLTKKVFEDRMRVERNNDPLQFDLIIWNVLSTDAGIYSCIDEAGEGERKSAELVVLGNNPMCATNISSMDGTHGYVVEGDRVEISVDLNYTARNGSNVQFSIGCRMSNEISNSVTGICTLHSIGYQVCSTHVTAHSDQCNRTIQCTVEVAFRNFGTSRSLETCSSPMYDVYYKPKSIRISPFKDRYTYGENLTCTADSNPAPTYQWLIWIDPSHKAAISSVGPEAPTDQLWLKSFQNGTIQCTATNIYGSIVVKAPISMLYSNQNAGCNLKPIITTIGVLFTVLLGAAVTIGLCWAVRGRDQKKGSISDYSALRKPPSRLDSQTSPYGNYEVISLPDRTYF